MAANSGPEIQNPKLITILGPTATGKTSLAASLANKIGGEVISGDSRQVYRGMTLGTGKDLNDYIVDGKLIPYHMIDIVDAGYEYNVFEYVNDFRKAYNNIVENNKVPILCGGSGMYIEAVLKGYELQHTPVNEEIRKNILNKTDGELIEILKSHKQLHNVTDTKDRSRLVRAVEIALQSTVHRPQTTVNANIFGIYFEREVIRKRITERLEIRLKSGMIEEVKALNDNGLSESKLKYYGLEYKYIAMYLNNELDYTTMFEKLNTAIHQFAKRQMTWFRRMEKQGFEISWIDGNLEMEDKMEKILNLLK
jgi:tRNA dimethylallyltransferase